VSIEHEILTPEEAATFLRLSRSTVYQRPDIPRHRMPGSRQIRFIKSELLSWLKGELVGQTVMEDTAGISVLEPQDTPVIDIANGHVYHRNARYR
jgi:excisionase family DNA binding protein